MSRNQRLLRSLALHNYSPERVARELNIDVKCLRPCLESDWPPVPKRHIAALDELAKKVLRGVYFDGARALARDRMLTGDRGRSLMDGLRADFFRFFGETIDGASPPLPFDTSRALRALLRLGVALTDVERECGGAEELNLRAISLREREADPAQEITISEATRRLLRGAYRDAVRRSLDNDERVRRAGYAKALAVLDVYESLFNDGSQLAQETIDHDR